MAKYADPEKLEAADDAVRLVLHRYWRSRDELVEPKSEQFEEWYKAYRSVVEIDDDDIRTQLVVPMIFSDVESLVSRMAGLRPTIEVWGRDQTDEVRADAHRALLRYDWDALDMLLKLIEYVKSAEIYGTAWMKVVHKRTEATRLVKEPTAQELDEFGQLRPDFSRGFTFRPKRVETWNDPWVDLCEIDQVFPDPDGKDVESCDYIIHRIPTTLHALESARNGTDPLYKNLGALKEKLKEANAKKANQSKQTLREMTRQEFDNASSVEVDPFKREITLLEHWTDSKVITIVEEFPDLPPIRNEYNPCGKKPFVRFTPIPDPNSIYGLSIPEVLYSLQVELSAIHSARIDNLMYAVHQMFLILKGSGLHPRNIKFRPGGHIWVRDASDITPLPRQSMDFSLYRETDEIRRWGQLAGVTDTFSGIRSDLTGGTATEATILAEASGSKAALMFTLLGWQALKPLARLLIKLNEMYIDRSKLIRIAGDEFTEAEFLTIEPEVLLSGTGVDLDVIMDIAQSEPETRVTRLQRAERGLSVLAQLGMPLNHPVMQVQLTNWLRAQGHNNPEAIVNSPEAQQAALAQEQGAGGAAGGQENAAQQIAALLGGAGA